MAASQVPVAQAAFSAPATAAAWRTKPSYAILTTQDFAANPDLQRWMYQRARSKLTTVEASHAVHISHPQIVAHIIEEAVSSTAHAGE
jgi:pimeloyl-ACP methyl ester carboxylesterase